MNQTTLLLVGHGSREPSGNQEIEDFAQAWRAQRPQWRIEVCFIEFSAATLERGLDAAAQGIVAGGQQHRCAIQAFREIGPVTLDHGWRGEQAGGEVAEAGVEHLQVATYRRGAVGQHDVKAVQGEFGEQGFELALVADQAYIGWHLGHSG